MDHINRRIVLPILSGIFLCLTFFAIGCSAQTEEQALASLRQMALSGMPPTDDYLTSIERRFAGRRAGALARLLHARMKLDSKEFAAAASLLASEDIAKHTKLGDYALWLRGRALQQAGDHAEAMRVFERLTREYPDSVRVDDARLRWADSAIAAGQAMTVPALLGSLVEERNAAALVRMARAYESLGDQAKAVQSFRQAYFFGAGSDAAKEAEARLTALAQPLTPQNADEAIERADDLFAAKNFAEAEKAYAAAAASFTAAATPAVSLKRLKALASLKRAADAQTVFNAIPPSAKEKEEAYYQLALAYARARLWPQAKQTIDEMRQRFANGRFTPKAMIDVGLEARAAKNRVDEGNLLKAAVTAYPNAIEVAQAQFELAWYEHEIEDFAESSRMFVEHLARYVDRDNTNRGKAGYWAARDSERAGKIADACILYDAVIYRYNANWYGYLAAQRVGALKSQGKCQGATAASEQLAKAVANLKTVTVARETAGPRELAFAARSDDLSAAGIFDWAIDELNAAKRTAADSPRINLALARHHRLKGDNVSAFLALARSYPDYAQMFPEEMSREEWEIFYPLTNWKEIKYWAAQRRLDPYQVAGLIRQESVFNPTARSSANAYGLMQLILPTARATARKYGSTATIDVPTLYNPNVNIELGTAYLRDQLDKFGRIEYVAAAYNAGPGRIPTWRATLPLEIDEFVEEIPFKETRQYVMGVVRNTAQYRRLYDENGSFKPNVGTRPLRGEIDTKSDEQLATENPDVLVARDAGE
ncbi:MAG: transglycosylase SLT domain-containing protein [Pyrinomonadaceae bacterium]